MASIVVVFGAAVRADGSPSGTLARRVGAAYLFGRQRTDVQYLVSGAIGASSYPEWQVMRHLLLEAGVPAERIMVERDGTDTLRQVRNCAAILRRLSVTDGVWISTSRYHQARCWLLFRLMGFKTGIVPALPDRPELPIGKLLYFWAREIAALPYDALLAAIKSK